MLSQGTHSPNIILIEPDEKPTTTPLWITRPIARPPHCCHSPHQKSHTPPITPTASAHCSSQQRRHARSQPVSITIRGSSYRFLPSLGNCSDLEDRKST